ncbi:MAG: YdaU family protein [Pseudomonadota bacterium]
MAKLFYYRHKIGDYDTATKDLSMLEHGCYRRLMDGYYANKGPLINAFASLCRIVGAFMPDEQEALRKIVGMYFDTTSKPGYLVKEVCDEEIARVLSESERQAAAARSRWGKGEADSASDDAAAPAMAHAAASAAASAAVMPVKIQDSKALPPISPTPAAARAKKAKDNRDSYRFERPEHLPEEAWDKFVEMRQRIRRPLTEWGKHLIEIEIGKLREAGSDPKAVLEQSTANSWSGVFQVKKSQQSGRRSQTEAANDETADNWASGER